jgi:Holliday junction resolvase RusA-like endonuclease
MPTVRIAGDLDKMARALMDALTYNEDKNPVGLYKDDSQVVKINAIKLYTNEKNPEEHN